MSTTVSAPCFDGECLPFDGYGQQVHLWPRVAGLEPSGRPAAFALKMDAAARQVRLAAGNEVMAKAAEDEAYSGHSDVLLCS